MHPSKLLRPVVGLLLVGALVGCNAADDDRADGQRADGEPTRQQARAYVEAIASQDRERLDAVRDSVMPGSAADDALEVTYAGIDLGETQGAGPSHFEVKEVGDAWELCAIGGAGDCQSYSNFTGADQKIESYDIDGTSIDEFPVVVGDGTPAVDGEWGSVTLRYADAVDGALQVSVTIEAGPSGLTVRDGVVFRDDNGVEMAADMTSHDGPIPPGEKATFAIFATADEVAGEIELPIWTEDGEFDDTVVMPLEGSAS